MMAGKEGGVCDADAHLTKPELGLTQARLRLTRSRAAS